MKTGMVLVIAGLLLGAGQVTFAAHTGLSSTTEDLVIMDQGTVTDFTGASPDFTRPILLVTPENENLTLATNLSVNILTSALGGTNHLFNGNGDLTGGSIPAGTKVNTYFFHADNKSGDNFTRQEGILILEPGFSILGVQVLEGKLDGPDGNPRLGLGRSFWPGKLNGLELGGGTNDDRIRLRSDLDPDGDWTWIKAVRVATAKQVDDFRIITVATDDAVVQVVPEPATMLMLAAGGILVLARRTRNSR